MPISLKIVPNRIAPTTQSVKQFTTQLDVETINHKAISETDLNILIHTLTVADFETIHLLTNILTRINYTTQYAIPQSVLVSLNEQLTQQPAPKGSTPTYLLPSLISRILNNPVMRSKLRGEENLPNSKSRTITHDAQTIEILDNILRIMQSSYPASYKDWTEGEISSYSTLAQNIAEQSNLTLIDSLIVYNLSLIKTPPNNRTGVIGYYLQEQYTFTSEIQSLNQMLQQNLHYYNYHIATLASRAGLDPTLPTDWLKEILNPPLPVPIPNPHNGLFVPEHP